MTIDIPSVLRSQVTTCRTQRLAACWKITTTTGDIYRFTDSPQELLVREAEHGARFTYTPTGGIDASAGRREDELQSVNKEIRGILTDDAILSEDLRAGLFDGASIDEYLVDARRPWIGYIQHITYYVKSVKYNRGTWNVEVDGIPSYLELPVGDIWSPTCRVDLFSPKCGLVETDWDNTTAVVSDIITQRLVIRLAYSVAGALASWNTAGWADDGTVIWGAGGPTSGLRNNIKTHTDTADGGIITLHHPTAYDIELGQFATLLPGCNKKSGVERNKDGTRAPGHCKDKFSNLVNFQGEPAIPGRDRSFTGIPFR